MSASQLNSLRRAQRWGMSLEDRVAVSYCLIDYFPSRCSMPRDGRFKELLGTYDPAPANQKTKNVRMHIERFKYWISVGAQPSEAVATIASKFNLYPPLPVRADIKMSEVLPELYPQPVVPILPAANEMAEGL